VDTVDAATDAFDQLSDITESSELVFNKIDSLLQVDFRIRQMFSETYSIDTYVDILMSVDALRAGIPRLAKRPVRGWMTAEHRA
jgi:hypothetical protein